MAISHGGQGQGKIFTEINITPLTDIFLVLLIVMMVIAPMFENANHKLKMPAILSGKAIEDHKITVEITKKGDIFIGGQRVAENNLEQTLRGWSDKTHEKLVILRADKDTASSQVIKVYEAASQAGFEKLTIAGEPLNGQREDKLESQGETPQGETP